MTNGISWGGYTYHRPGGIGTGTITRTAPTPPTPRERTWRETLGEAGRAPAPRAPTPIPRGEKEALFFRAYPEARGLSGRALTIAMSVYPTSPTSDIIMTQPGGDPPPKLSEIVSYLAAPEGRKWVETLDPKWESFYLGGQPLSAEEVQEKLDRGEGLPMGGQVLGYVPETGQYSVHYPLGLGALEKAVVTRRTGWPYTGQAAGETYAQYVERMRGWAGRGAPRVAPMMRAPTTAPMAGVPPTYWKPRYEPGWQQFLGEQDLPWEREKWTESLFPSLVEKYKATQPKPMTAYGEWERQAEARRREAGWATYLREYPLEEEWYGMPAAERGEMPGRFAPMIRTRSY